MRVASAPGSRWEQLRRAGPRGAARLVYRKAIHRKVQMRRYEMPAGASVVPDRPLELPVELHGPGRVDAALFEEVLRDNPHSDPSDLDHFLRQRTCCILVRDGTRIAASTWMTGGRVHVHELGRTVSVDDTEHFLCRSYVDPDYRGLHLLSHMIHAYAASQRPADVLWGLVYDWNVHSIRSLERLGWRHTGDYRTDVLAGRTFTRDRRFAPRPPETL